MDEQPVLATLFVISLLACQVANQQLALLNADACGRGGTAHVRTHARVRQLVTGGRTDLN